MQLHIFFEPSAMSQKSTKPAIQIIRTICKHPKASYEPFWQILHVTRRSTLGNSNSEICAV